MNLFFFFFLISNHLVPASYKIQALDLWCSFCWTLYYWEGSVCFLGAHLELATYRFPGQGTKALSKVTRAAGAGGWGFYLPFEVFIFSG